MVFIYTFFYILIASGCIFGLLVGAAKHTNLECPIGYVLCGLFWPVAALPASAYIAATWYTNREEYHGK